MTEFLPVSSTGHLVVANRLLGHSDATFEVAIQAGAITAIVVLYWRRLWSALCGLFARRTSWTSNLLVLIVAAAFPAAVLGVFLDDAIDAALFRPSVVAGTMVVGGGLLLWLESWLRRRGAQRGEGLEQLGLRQAIGIGLFQCLALIPGTSRSGATIAGGLLLGLTRTAAAEFSFLVGLPILYGACTLKLFKARHLLHGEYLRDLSIAAVVSFVTAILVVIPFVRFLQRHTFVPFAWYRIAAGAALAILIARGVLAV